MSDDRAIILAVIVAAFIIIAVVVGFDAGRRGD